VCVCLYCTRITYYCTVLLLHTRTHAQPVYGSLDFVRGNPGEPVPEEMFTHSHLLWSSIIPYLLPLSITIHGILPVQFKYLTDFFQNLSPSFLWSTSWPGTLHFILHTFLHPIIVFFRSTCPYHCNLFHCSTKIMSSNPSLSLKLYLVTSHHTSILPFSSLPAGVPPHFPFFTGQVLLPCNIVLRTQLPR